MEFGTLLVLLVLACPLMMVWMMRGHGGHGHASHGPDHGHMRAAGGQIPSVGSLDELRRRRAELDAEIAELEGAETETPPRSEAAHE